MQSGVSLSESNSVRLLVFRTLIYIVLVILSLLAILPVWLVLVNASRSTPEIRAGLSLIPGTSFGFNWRFINGRDIGVLSGYKNSAIISFSSTILTVYFSMLTAYAIEVYNFKFKDTFRKIIYVLVLIPQQVSVMGFFAYMNKLGLVNSFIPLIVPAIAAPASVFFAEQYLQTSLVKDLILSARIDGCGEFTIFHKVMMPMAKPGIFTLSILSLVASWNNFFLPSLLLTSKSKYTVPLVVKLLNGDAYRTELGAVYMGIGLSLLPVVVIYLFMSKQIVGGLTLGALKE